MLEARLAQVLFARAAPKRYLVALSGGVDSTVLLHALVRIVPPDTKVIALHGNHRLQNESATWLQHCAAMCANLGVEFVSAELTVATAGNLEAAARKARYEFFANYIQAGDLLLLGHHAQDQVETVLLRIFQGRGLISMRQSGVLGAGEFMRPLLKLSRAELVDYAQGVEASWVEDPSNGDLRFDRNFLRGQVVPLLQKRWPSMTQALLRLTNTSNAQNLLLEHLLRRAADKVALDTLPEDDNVKLLWLRNYVSVRGHYDVTDRSLSEWVRQAYSSGHSELVLGGHSMLRSWRRTLYYGKQEQPGPITGSLAIGESLSTGSGELQLLECDAQAADGFIYEGPVEVVSRCKFEGISLSRSFGSASLKTLFQQSNIPPWSRDHYPLIMRDGELLAIPGIASRKKTKSTHSSVWCRGVLTENSDLR